MRALVIGGTRFLGRHIVEALLDRGDDVVLLNRGRSNPGLYSGVEAIVADRAVIEREHFNGRSFDAVFDTCGYSPDVVARGAEALRPLAQRYVFVSTISVYDLRCAPVDETSPLLGLPDGIDTAVRDDAFYGELKSLCETAISTRFGTTDSFVVRPGLIVGPYDYTDRFSYWPWRIARGGDVLAPIGPAYSIQCIDARDLARWIVEAAFGSVAGTYNATSTPFPFGDIVAAALPSGGETRLHYFSDDELDAAGVEPWIEMPLWNARRVGYSGLFDVDVSRARAAGLRTRPIAESVRETLEWVRNRDPSHEWKAGMTAEREANILARR